MKALANAIERRLSIARQEQCAVYESDLQRLWPLEDQEREAKIAQFAKEFGFRLRAYRQGVCAIFDKEPPSSRN